MLKSGSRSASGTLSTPHFARLLPKRTLSPSVASFCEPDRHQPGGAPVSWKRDPAPSPLPLRFGLVATARSGRILVAPLKEATLQRRTAAR